jgi:pimeloyl-ACP methyl ester carboxylesterase
VEHHHRLVTPIRFGEDSLPVILFLPGMSGNNRQWDAVLPQLNDVRADLAYGAAILANPAFGESQPSVTGLARAMADELRAMERSEIILVSHSVGAFVALGIARELPAMVKTVILVNGDLACVARFLDKPLYEMRNHPRACVTYMRLFALVSAPVPPVFKRTVASRRWLTQALLGNIVSASVLGSRTTRESLMGEAAGLEVLPSLWKNRHHWREFSSYADQISQSTLFVVGDKDPISSAKSRPMAELLPGSTTRFLEGVGHAAPLEAPGAVAGIIREATVTVGGA